MKLFVDKHMIMLLRIAMPQEKSTKCRVYVWKLVAKGDSDVLRARNFVLFLKYKLSVNYWLEHRDKT